MCDRLFLPLCDVVIYHLVWISRVIAVSFFVSFHRFSKRISESFCVSLGFAATIRVMVKVITKYAIAVFSVGNRV